MLIWLLFVFNNKMFCLLRTFHTDKEGTSREGASTLRRFHIFQGRNIFSDCIVQLRLFFSYDFKVLVLKELTLRSKILGFSMEFNDLLGTNLGLATVSLPFLSPPVYFARWAHMRRFLSVCLSGCTQGTLYTTTTVYGLLSKNPVSKWARYYCFDR